jgi:hypothetical protein
LEWIWLWYLLLFDCLDVPNTKFDLYTLHLEGPTWTTFSGQEHVHFNAINATMHTLGAASTKCYLIMCGLLQLLKWDFFIAALHKKCNLITIGARTKSNGIPPLSTTGARWFRSGLDSLKKFPERLRIPSYAISGPTSSFRSGCSGMNPHIIRGWCHHISQFPSHDWWWRKNSTVDVNHTSLRFCRSFSNV